MKDIRGSQGAKKFASGHKGHPHFRSGILYLTLPFCFIILCLYSTTHEMNYAYAQGAHNLSPITNQAAINATTIAKMNRNLSTAINNTNNKLYQQCS